MTPEAKLQRLKVLLEAANQDTFSQKQFLEAFEKVIQVFKVLRTSHEKEVESMKALIFSMLSEIQSKNKEMTDSTKEKMMEYCIAEVEKITKDWEKMQKKHDTKMSAMDKKMNEVVSGKDADEEKVKKEVLAVLTPQIPKIEDIENNIPKLGIPIRDSLELLQGEDRLDRKAIKGLDELEKQLGAKIDAIPRGGGGGGLMRGATKYYKLTPNGSTKIFDVPKSTTAIVFGSDFPHFWFENTGYTINASRTQITLTSDDAPSTGSQLVYSYSPMFGS